MIKKLHKPKHIYSSQGLGLPNTTKRIEEIDDRHLLLSEIWNDMNDFWTQGSDIIAKPGYKWLSRWDVGNNYLSTEIYDETGNLVGTYYDICSPILKSTQGFEFEDWYLDVWKPVEQKAQLLDVDELKEAVNLGFITKDQAQIAQETADQLMLVIE